MLIRSILGKYHICCSQGNLNQSILGEIDGGANGDG